MENLEEKKTCYNCAYCKDVSGSAHKKCTFAWRNSELQPPKANERGIDQGWYIFPLNYDPVWQQEKCLAHSESADTGKVQEFTPLMEIMSIMGRRF